MPVEDLRIVEGICQNREGPHFEAKEVHAGIPRDTWETYSAFANTDEGCWSSVSMNPRRVSRLQGFRMPKT